MLKILSYLERRQNRKLAHKLGDIYNMQGKHYEKSGQYLLALNYYLFAIEIWNIAIEQLGADKDKYAYSSRGYLHEKLENFQEAYRDYEIARSLGDSFAQYRAEDVAHKISRFHGFEFFERDSNIPPDDSGTKMIREPDNPDPEMILDFSRIDLEDLKMQVEASIIESIAAEHPETMEEYGLDWIKDRDKYKERADYSYLMEDFETAAELYTKILDGDHEDDEILREYASEHLEMYIRRAMAHDESGKINDAITDYSKVLSINPRLTALYIKRGQAKMRSGDYTDAMQDYNKAFEKDERLRFIFDKSLKNPT